MKKVLITGADGLLGTTVVEVFKEGEYDVVETTIAELDITDHDAVSSKISAEKPDVIVNCAAYTNVDGCEDDGFETAKLVNGTAVGYLAEAAARVQAVFLHISSDYVDSNNSPEGFDESKTVLTPMNKYGETKLLGEREVQRVLDENPGFRAYIVRTSWLFGEGATNFIAKITKFAQEKDELSVVDDEVGTPTYVKDLALVLRDLAKGTAESGIYHVTSSNHCSRYEFAKKILELQNIDTPVKPGKLADWPRKAKISNYSILLNTKLPTQRTWEEMLEDYLGR
ncbi:dTDP-4-dehydrorhamnose reductase [Candidatus Nomurabacteria bacterium]|uniref:dTDP-4-dehydrorhamnose reductase n=1 Tax=Candidatus Dojkabacteria bacterium TaxID=2099670 RepID=A0A955KXC3_9BACT|nr:dTDP-4-dehydrorhamnose reductase [Candidatus Dojkabacteria bacterium]MCB9789527.1 dTDP-4-dehydrorhamnose reductase [Candidatus Nomurabacteria bacterium]